ncbi:ParB/RepB/Spo0J family partition protein [Streptomyces sp. NPDC059718]
MPRGRPGASSNAPKDSAPVALKEQPLVARGGGREVPIDKVTPNPRNLRGDDLWDTPEEKAEMVASITEVGLIQALVVASREAFLERFPEYGETIGSARYVVMAGHRRLGAALAAGLETIRIDVQDDLVARLNLVMLEENLKRKGLDTFQEGEGYRRSNTEDGLSYQEIAASTGRSKAHITKRVKLLELPESARVIVRSKRVSIDNAYNLLIALGSGDEKLFADACELLAAGGLDAKGAANQVLAGGTAKGRAVPQVAIGGSVAGDAQGGVVLTETTTAVGEGAPEAAGAGIPGARTAPAVKASASAESSTAKPLTTPQTQADASQKSETTPPSEDAERATASAQRNEVCAKLVAGFDSAQTDPATVRIAAAVLSSASKNALTRAHTWMQTAGAANASAVGAVSYRDAVLLNSDGVLTAHLAYAVALAEDELRASDRRRRWDHRDLAHVRHLIDAGAYVPTDWEKSQLS